MMKGNLHRWFSFLTVLFLIPGFYACPRQAAKVPPPPETKVAVVKEVLHGVEIEDPYRWLENRKDPEVDAWIRAQNAYTQSILSRIEGRERIRVRLTELMKVDSIGTPIERGGRLFFTKRLAQHDVPVLYLREGIEGEDQILIDPHPMSPDHTTTVHIRDVSPDGRLLVYGIREGGADEVTLRVMDVDQRENLPDVLPRARYYGVSLKPDKSGFFYAKHLREGPRVYYHVMGTDPADDPMIFGEGYGPDKIITPQLSEDGRYLLITVHHGTSGRTEVYFQDLTRETPIRTIVNDIDAQFYGDVADGTLYLYTNWNAPNWRLLAVDLTNPARENWREVIPESDTVLRGVSLVGGRIFASYLENVVSRVKIFTPDGRAVGEIAFPTLGSVSGVSGRWSSPHAFYSFTSFHMPRTIYYYNVENGKQQVWARMNVPINPDEFAVEQVWYTSKDGTRVPMFLVHRKGLKKTGDIPTLLYGYGGFNISLTPRFSALAAYWAEAGGVYAVANLRGGGEFGEKWHRAGMMKNKQNVFDDFIAAAEWLIQNGYTNRSRLAIMGGSNGGLLVGAALTQRPDLFRAVICSYPLLDMIRFHKFLVGSYWVSEYGSPDDPEMFPVLLSYSPYHNVKPGIEYPAVLFVTGDADTRVDPLHARKMTARLQAATAAKERPILLMYDTKAGHSGGKPLREQIADLTEEIAFLFWQLGVKPPAL